MICLCIRGAIFVPLSSITKIKKCQHYLCVCGWEEIPQLSHEAETESRSKGNEESATKVKRAREKEEIYLWKAKCICRKETVNAKQMASESEISATWY